MNFVSSLPAIAPTAQVYRDFFVGEALKSEVGPSPAAEARKSRQPQSLEHFTKWLNRNGIPANRCL
jgi:hypothetical protein